MADPKPARFVWRSPKQVAETLDVDERTVRRWCEQHLVEAEVTPGDKLWRVKCRESDEFPLRR